MFILVLTLNRSWCWCPSAGCAIRFISFRNPTPRAKKLGPAPLFLDARMLIEHPKREKERSTRPNFSLSSVLPTRVVRVRLRLRIHFFVIVFTFDFIHY